MRNVRGSKNNMAPSGKRHTYIMSHKTRQTNTQIYFIQDHHWRNSDKGKNIGLQFGYGGLRG